MHLIRLHGPWEFEALARFESLADGAVRERCDGLPAAGRMQAPADWREALGDEFRGRVRFTRCFHRPTGLAPGQRVFLAIERVGGRGDVSLNERMLGAAAWTGGPFRFDVTDSLALRNALRVEIASEVSADDLPDSRGLVGFVRLEIEEAE